MNIPKESIVPLNPQIMFIMLLGDSRCEIQKGKTVEKIKEDPRGDIHPIGSRGKVLGNLHNPFHEPHDAYYIQWENSDLKTLSVGAKIKEIK